MPLGDYCVFYRTKDKRVAAGNPLRCDSHFGPIDDPRFHAPSTQNAEDKTSQAQASTLPLQKPQTKRILQIVIRGSHKEDIRASSLQRKLCVKCPREEECFG